MDIVIRGLPDIMGDYLKRMAKELGYDYEDFLAIVFMDGLDFHATNKDWQDAMQKKPPSEERNN